MPCTYVHTLYTSVRTLYTAVHALHTAVHTLYTAVHTLRTAVHTLRTAVHTLRTAVHTLRTAVHTLRTAVHTLRTAADDKFGFSSPSFHPDGTVIMACSYRNDDMGYDAGMCYTFNVASCTELCELHPDVGVY